MKSNYVTKKISCFVLSIVLCVSITVSLFGVTTVCILHSRTRVADSISAYSSELKDGIDSALELQMPDAPIKAEAYAQSVDSKVLGKIINASAKNITLQKSNDFSLDADLYGAVYENLVSYASANKIKIPQQDISKLASYEIDVISGYLSQAKTDNVKLFQIVRSRTALLVIAVSVVLAILSYALIYFINDGRHMKNSYFGMAFVSAGAVEITGTFAARAADVAFRESYCGFEPFDKALADIAQTIMSVQIPLGIVLILTGLFVLVFNYRYFYKKNIKVSEQREQNIKLRDEYIKHYESKNAPKPEPIPGEREVMDIDF